MIWRGSCIRWWIQLQQWLPETGVRVDCLPFTRRGYFYKFSFSSIRAYQNLFKKKPNSFLRSSQVWKYMCAVSVTQGADLSTETPRCSRIESPTLNSVWVSYPGLSFTVLVWGTITLLMSVHDEYFTLALENFNTALNPPTKRLCVPSLAPQYNASSKQKW